MTRPVVGQMTQGPGRAVIRVPAKVAIQVPAKAATVTVLPAMGCLATERTASLATVAMVEMDTLAACLVDFPGREADAQVPTEHTLVAGTEVQKQIMVVSEASATQPQVGKPGTGS